MRNKRWNVDRKKIQDVTFSIHLPNIGDDDNDNVVEINFDMYVGTNDPISHDHELILKMLSIRDR